MKLNPSFRHATTAPRSRHRHGHSRRLVCLLAHSNAEVKNYSAIYLLTGKYIGFVLEKLNLHFFLYCLFKLISQTG